MDKKFFEEVMRIPTCSRHENMMAEFIMKWGRRHGCRASRDSKGNVYLTKGSAKHPFGCVNHIDSVHSDQVEMVEKGVYKELKWDGDKVTAVNPLTGRQTGIGADNQCGCAIALAVISRVPAIKAMFPVEEEIGCLGTKASDYVRFFKDCSFVFSNDSPDRNRATHYSSGTQLYSDGFFREFIEPVFKRHGVTRFNSEPWTDCRWVRQDAKGEDGLNLETINAGNGGYNPHSDTEYAVFSDVCAAEDMMVDLCDAVGTKVQRTSAIEEEPRPKYSGGYDAGMYFFGSATAGGDKDRSGENRSGSSRSPWGSVFRKKDSPRPVERFEFEWEFKSEKAMNRFLDQVSHNRQTQDVRVEQVAEKDLTVIVTGPRPQVETAWLFAFNKNAGVKYASLNDLFGEKPNLRRDFLTAIRSATKSQEDDEGKQVSIALDGFSSPAESDQFWDMLQQVPTLPPDVDFESDDGIVTVSGPMRLVQGIYVMYVNFINGVKYRSWRELEGTKHADAFRDAVVFSDGGKDEKERGGTTGPVPSWWNS